jgi:hypothetical protein
MFARVWVGFAVSHGQAFGEEGGTDVSLLQYTLDTQELDTALDGQRGGVSSAQSSGTGEQNTELDEKTQKLETATTTESTSTFYVAQSGSDTTGDGSEAHIENASLAPACSPTDKMCPLMDNTGCPNSCATDVTFDNIFIGGTSTCSQDICTCHLSTSRIDKITASSHWKCAELCEEHDECNFAFFRRWEGECFLLRECNQRISTWVGKKPDMQGGITFQKYQRPVAVSADGWPSRYFGNFAGLDYAAFSQNSPQPTCDDWSALAAATPSFSGSTGVADGYDWSLPTTAQASPMGKVANVRVFGMSNFWLDQVKKAPVIPGLHQTVEIWVKWHELETADGVFNFTTFDTFLAAAGDKGFTVYVRLMTSDKTSAPTYFESNAALKELIGDAPVDRVPHSKGEVCPSQRGQPWNIESDEFHQRYLRLVGQLQPYCQSDVVSHMFVGWMSCSNGDEGIGPSSHGYDGHHGEEEPKSVRDRLDKWNEICAGKQQKVIMGGKSTYGRSMGFGLREGFVEMYWYRAPDTSYYSYEGHKLDTATGHIDIDETNVLANGQASNADENEEYVPAWSSEWRCAGCSSMSAGDKGGAWDGAAAAAGSQSRFGSIESFPYRYMLSSLRALHLRSTMLILSPDSVVNVALSRYVGLSLGHSSSSTPDAWCFLVQGDTSGGRMINWERWLTQRDSIDPSVNGGQPSVPEARFPTTPADAGKNPVNKPPGGTEFVARAATELAFALSATFVTRLQQAVHAWVKVSFFDVGEARSILLLRGGVAAAGVRTCSTEVLGRVDLGATPTDQVRTATFSLQPPPDLTTFCVAGRDSVDGQREIIVSLVRIII